MCLAQGPQRSDAGEARTRGLSVSSQALNHCAPPYLYTWNIWNPHSRNPGPTPPPQVHRTCRFIGHMPRSRNFRQRGGGGGGSDKKKALTTLLFFFVFCFFSHQLILQKSNGHFQRNLSFFKVPIFSRGGQLFPGGVQSLIPYRNPYNSWFSRWSRPSVLPLDPHLGHRGHRCTYISLY